MTTNTDNVVVQTSTGIDGSTFTTNVSNDTLTNDDFLKLMIQELKLQDPTKPMDSSQMLSTQMQMSTIETNLQLSNSMKALESSIAKMSLSSASGFMGKKIDAVADMPVKNSSGDVILDKDGNALTEKTQASFLVSHVEVRDGVTYLISNELVGFQDVAIDNETKKSVPYDKETGQIKNEDGEFTDYFIKMENGRFDKDSDGKIVIVDADGKVVKPSFTPDGADAEASKYAFHSTNNVYDKNSTSIKYEDIVKVYA